jgi:carboxyl-terminal processing protease
VQQVIDLGDGSGLKLTVARYFTPSHRSIQDHGIAPDVEVAEAEPVASAAASSPPPATLAIASSAATATATPTGNPPKPDSGRDAALEAALTHVKVRAQSRLP